jgi:uncharacterized membrane protein
MNKLMRNHRRLWISVAAGCATFFFLPEQWSTSSRVLVCWDCGVALFLVLVFSWMVRLTAEQICMRYIEEDDSAPIILVAVTIAALLSLVAIIEPLVTIKGLTGMQRAWHFALSAVTLLNSWVLVPTMFTTHYADMFYSGSDGHRPLHFPDTPQPVFWDFVYFSFTIAAACQTADVSTLNARARKTVVAHTIISFLFNASILGFAINVTAGIIGGN